MSSSNKKAAKVVEEPQTVERVLLECSKKSKAVHQESSKYDDSFNGLRGRQRKLRQLEAQIEKINKESINLDDDLDEFGIEVSVTCDIKEYAPKNIAKEKARALEQDAEIKRRKEKYANLKKRKQEQEHETGRHNKCKEFMEEVTKMYPHKFNNLAELTAYLERVRDTEEKLDDINKQMEERQKTQIALEKQLQDMKLEKERTLNKLKVKHSRQAIEFRKRDKQWNEIKKIATMRALIVVQMKFAIHDLYEYLYKSGFLIKQDIGRKAMDINDTQRQLDIISTWYLDYNEIMKSKTANTNATPQDEQ